jgi:hypothetical protein
MLLRALLVVGVGNMATAQFAPTINGNAETWSFNAAASDEFAGSTLDASKWKQTIGDWRGELLLSVTYFLCT